MEERMKRLLLAAGLIVLLGLMGACSKEAPEDAVDPMEQAWAELREAVGELETAEEKMPLIETFMREHPDTEYSGMLAGAVAYYQGREMEDPEGALALLDETLAKNTDPEARYQIGMAMFPLSAELGQPTDLGAVAQELAATRELKFTEMIDVADTAIDHDQWDVGATYAEMALAKATPEAFLADYPDDDYTQEEAAAKAVRRQAMGLADLGWAQWNLGLTDEAMATFEQASAHRTVDYLGVADTPVDLYHGKAMLAAENPDRAMELLAPDAVMASNSKAMHALKEAYVASKGGEDGFKDWIWSERQRLARNVDDFALADYEGVSHDFSALSDGQVTLLAFWFPT
jgi:tetratricopeptide (TPR) repeat protein